jgi:hypothetical protein
VTTKPNSPEDSATLKCRKCHEPIQLRSEDDVLDKFGGFVRLRCAATDCGNEDWYKKPAFTPAVSIAQPVPEGPGEVWIHDVILGLSFRAESAGHELAG